MNGRNAQGHLITNASQRRVFAGKSGVYSKEVARAILRGAAATETAEELMFRDGIEATDERIEEVIAQAMRRVQSMRRHAGFSG